MKILQLVKTSDGARWAVEQVKELVDMGLELAVVLPTPFGKMMQKWQKTGAKLYFANVEISPLSYKENKKRESSLLTIVEEFKPDIIHSHFFSQTILARKALKKMDIPLIFQVPGPLHLENKFFKTWDLQSARKNDFWIASSWAIKKLYLDSHVAEDKVFVSYYGNHIESYQEEGQDLREELRLSEKDFLIGNVSYFYAPKKYLLQTKGLKGHELCFKAVSQFKAEYAHKGVFWGEQWGGRQNYYQSLKKKTPSNIILPGPLAPFEVSRGWRTLDLCLHLPFSENCGGVVEPLIHDRPIVASNTGGIPEIIIHKVTGLLSNRNISDVIKNLEWAYHHQDEMRLYAEKGKKLVQHTFNVKRTAQEIYNIYFNLYNKSLINSFDPRKYVEEI